MTHTEPDQPLFGAALQRVEAFLKTSRQAETTFGKNAAGDDGFVSRLRAGRVTFRVAQRALDYIARQEAAAEATSNGDRVPSDSPSVASDERIINRNCAETSRQIGVT